MKPNFVAYFHQTIRIWSICYIYAIFIVEWNLETYGNEIDLASVDPLTLANSLGRFYCEARPQPKKSKESESQNEEPLYHKNSLINIRAAINRHLADLRREIDIVHDKEFKTPNGILDGLFKERTRLGLSKPTQHKAIIDDISAQNLHLPPRGKDILNYSPPCSMVFSSHSLCFKRNGISPSAPG